MAEKYFPSSRLLLLFTRLMFILPVLLFLASCNSDKGKNIPDVSGIEVALNVSRFEKDLFSADTTNIGQLVTQLEEKYPDFFQEIFLGKIIPPLQDPAVLALFVKAPEVRHLYDTCMVVFSDFEKTEEELVQAFKFYRYYFPDKDIPQIITYISEYSLGNFTLEDEQLGIGLDFFLGADYPRYNPSFFPQYMKRTMNKDHLVAKSMQTLVKNRLGEASGNRLLDKMIHNGKALYILDHLLPYEPDSIKLEYTPAQVKWVAENELQIWAHFLKEDLLYSTKMRDIRKLIDYSPNSPGMPAEAPGRTANWVGWQIVKSYMQRYPKTTMEELIQMEDAQKILEMSKYKPQRQ